MARTKTMYFNSSSNGWWTYLLKDGSRWSAPQHLKVEVDLDKSDDTDRFYFKVVEGPWVVPGVHFKQYQANAGRYVEGNISKRSGITPTLVEANPHTAAVDLKVIYQSHQFLEYGGLATPVVVGKLAFAGVEKEIVMTGDLIIPNTLHPICIPDEKHTDQNSPYIATDFYSMWFRIDAKTAEQNFTGYGTPGDRYFHLGRGSAGCFTNIYTNGNDRVWNTIADTLSKARAGSNQLYVGNIEFQIPRPTYTAMRSELIAFARSKGIIRYVWENATHAAI